MRVAAIGYATSQGLGHLLRSFFEAGVVTDPIVYRHGHWSRPTNLDWYPQGTLVVEPRRDVVGQPGVRELLGRVRVLLAFETFFDWHLVHTCRSIGVKTALVVMHEWTPKVWPAKPDAVFCPSLLDVEYFREEFPCACPFLRVPVDPSHWRLRKHALHFVHNAGNVGHREHKGTRQFLEAIPLVQSPARFTVRAQDTAALDSILESVPAVKSDPRVEFHFGEVPYAELWKEGDVYVAPEKFNGLSLPLQEARAAGMLVLTTDRFPTNQWLWESGQGGDTMIRPARVERACVSRQYREFDESVVEPAAVAACIDYWYGKEIFVYSGLAKGWAEANTWKQWLPHYRAALEALVVGQPLCPDTGGRWGWKSHE